MIFKSVFTFCALMFSIQASAECKQREVIDSAQAQRVLSQFVQSKSYYQLVFGKTTWAGSYCKVQVSPLNADGGFDVTAREISSLDDSEVRSITVSVPRTVEANVDCEVYSEQRPVKDLDIIEVYGDFDKPESEQRSGFERRSSGKRVWLNLRDGIVSASDYGIKPTFIQSYTNTAINLLDCR